MLLHISLLSWHPSLDAHLTTSPLLQTGCPLDLISPGMAYHFCYWSPLWLWGLPMFPCSYPYFCQVRPASHVWGSPTTPSCSPLCCVQRLPCSNPKTWLISLLSSTPMCNSADLLVTYFLATSRQLHALILPNTLVWLYLTLHFTHCHPFLLPFFSTFFHIRSHQCIQRWNITSLIFSDIFLDPFLSHSTLCSSSLYRQVCFCSSSNVGGPTHMTSSQILSFIPLYFLFPFHFYCVFLCPTPL